ncbi:hypothetical protein [Bacillus pumilus]|uniref:hypothetical protein n=1 Tax=Bacillus pumilus TaxID=1408 RepID=UPI0038999506
MDLPEGLVIISGEEDTWIAMDYRETKEHPPIHYFDLELEVDFKLADTLMILLRSYIQLKMRWSK